MTEKQERPAIRLICNGDGPGPMVHYPNGRIEWLDGLRKYLSFAWWCVRNNHRVVIVDAKTGKESES